MTSNMRILNGRKLGDSNGSFTCHTHNGQSAVDYVLINEEGFDSDFIFFSVEDYGCFSDHSRMIFQIRCQNNGIKTTPTRLTDNITVKKYKWDHLSNARFQAALNKERSIQQITTTQN